MAVYQNQGVYDAAVAALAGRSDIAAFVTKARALSPDAEARVFVNPCARYWTPGSEPDFCVYVGLKDGRGHNILSYNGVGRTLGEAIASADEYLRDFVNRKTADPHFLYDFGGQP